MNSVAIGRIYATDVMIERELEPSPPLTLYHTNHYFVYIVVPLLCALLLVRALVRLAFQCLKCSHLIVIIGQLCVSGGASCRA